MSAKTSLEDVVASVIGSVESLVRSVRQLAEVVDHSQRRIFELEDTVARLEQIRMGGSDD